MGNVISGAASELLLLKASLFSSHDAQQPRQCGKWDYLEI
jgi:hypothetical protein